MPLPDVGFRIYEGDVAGSKCPSPRRKAPLRTPAGRLLPRYRGRAGSRCPPLPYPRGRRNRFKQDWSAKVLCCRKPETDPRPRLPSGRHATLRRIDGRATRRGGRAGGHRACGRAAPASGRQAELRRFGWLGPRIMAPSRVAVATRQKPSRRTQLERRACCCGPSWRERSAAHGQEAELQEAPKSLA